MAAKKQLFLNLGDHVLYVNAILCKLLHKIASIIDSLNRLGIFLSYTENLNKVAATYMACKI